MVSQISLNERLLELFEILSFCKRNLLLKFELLSLDHCDKCVLILQIYCRMLDLRLEI